MCGGVKPRGSFAVHNAASQGLRKGRCFLAWFHTCLTMLGVWSRSRKYESSPRATMAYTCEGRLTELLNVYKFSSVGTMTNRSFFIWL
jgi:hypothetical protein